MDIPFDIKIFNWIYESGKYLLPLLFILWLTWLIYVIILRRKRQFLFTSVAFLLFCLLGAAFTWSGWYYRMQLRERYAVVKQETVGGQKSRTEKVYNINLMPADIRREYAKDGYRPRRRGVIAQFVWVILLTPFTFLVQWLLYRKFFRRKKNERDTDISVPPEDWKNRLARAGFIAGAIIGIGHFLLIGSATNWLLCSCVPLLFPLIWGTWKNWRIPALVLTLLFLWGGTISCVRDIKRSHNLKMISNMYHDRAGFDFEKVFPPLPEKIAVGADGVGGMRFKSLDGSRMPYIQFLNALPSKGFKPLAKNTVVLRYNGTEDTCKRFISGDAFYKYLGKGFGAVAEYNGECCSLFLIRGSGD
ncbi:MAG: hypothetical protein IJV93_10240 [Lentisphaeria bacterium]|nr:hypothetical protein [Lentisphaeria bacterium]